MKQNPILFRFTGNKILYSILMVLTISACSNSKNKSLKDYQNYRIATRDQLKKKMGEKYNTFILPKNDNQSIKKGKGIYLQVCSSCHGTEGYGDGKYGRNLPRRPTNFTDPEQAEFFSENARLEIIRKGIEGSPMKGWESILSEDDIYSVYFYMQSLINMGQNEY